MMDPSSTKLDERPPATFAATSPGVLPTPRSASQLPVATAATGAACAAAAASPGVSDHPGAAGSSRGAAGRRLTLLDVAQALRVSRTTVSNAFNQPQRLSKALREEIIQKSRELGYFGPDPAARALRRNATQAAAVAEVAVIFHHNLQYTLGDPPCVDFLRGVAAELDRRQLSLQLIPRLGRRLATWGAFQTTADALIVHAELDEDHAALLRALRKPVVMVDAQVPGLPSVGIDDRRGASLAMRHALAARPDRVLVFSFPLGASAAAVALPAGAEPRAAPPVGHITRARAAGYAEAAEAAGFPPERLQWVQVDGQTPEAAGPALHEALARLAQADLAAQAGPDATPRSERLAVVAMSDRMALAVQAAWPLGQRPAPVAVVGFDDIAAAAEAGLTTIRQDHRLKGEAAVHRLLGDLSGAGRPHAAGDEPGPSAGLAAGPELDHGGPTRPDPWLHLPVELVLRRS